MSAPPTGGAPRNIGHEIYLQNKARAEAAKAAGKTASSPAARPKLTAEQLAGCGSTTARCTPINAGPLEYLSEVERNSVKSDRDNRDNRDTVMDKGSSVTEIPAPKPSPVEPSIHTPQVLTAHLHTPPSLAKNPLILKAFAAAVSACGVIGEIALAQLLYLVITARVLLKPVSAVVKGLSASGKSFTTEQVIKFFPSTAVSVMTAMSQRALVYSPEDYRHKVIVLYEVTGMREGVEDDLTAGFIRTLLSEGRIDYWVTVRDSSNGWTARHITKEGPTGLITTTTRTALHHENETRMLSLTTNDSREQTKNIFRKLAIPRVDSAADMQEWVDLQIWIQTAEHRVVIPYAADLAELVPPVAVRLRRDFSLVLSLIQAHAILHQLNRERDDDGRIIASLEDYAEVRELVAGVISENVGTTVSDTIRETVAAIDELTQGENSDVADGVMRLAISKKLKLDVTTVSRRLSAAAGKGYIRNLETKRGKPGRWVIGDPLPEKEMILPHPDQLCTSHTPLQALNGTSAQQNQGVCSSATTDRGVYTPDAENEAEAAIADAIAADHEEPLI